MPAKLASELLYDSEAALRLVDNALDGLRDPDVSPAGLDVRLRAALAPSAGANGELGLIGLSQLLMRGYAEIVSVLSTLRESRTMLERTAVDRIQQTHAKLREVSSATESAATSILDGLDRASVLVDELDRVAGENGDGSEIRGQLRDELFTLMGHMQFQDITSQQLSYASSVLAETEERLARLAAVFDPSSFGVITPATIEKETSARDFDPQASTLNAEARQAVADEVFTPKPRT